jgi:hypothetical protein
VYLSSNRIRATTVDINGPPTSSSIYFVHFSEWVCAFAIIHRKVFGFRKRGAKNKLFPQIRFFFAAHIQEEKVIVTQNWIDKIYVLELRECVCMEIMKAILIPYYEHCPGYPIFIMQPLFSMSIFLCPNTLHTIPWFIINQITIRWLFEWNYQKDIKFPLNWVTFYR